MVKITILILLMLSYTSYSQEITRVFEYENMDYTELHKFHNIVIYDIEKKTFNIYSQDNNNMKSIVTNVFTSDGVPVFVCKVDDRIITCFIHEDMIVIFFKDEHKEHVLILS